MSNRTIEDRVTFALGQLNLISTVLIHPDVQLSQENRIALGEWIGEIEEVLRPLDRLPVSIGNLDDLPASANVN